MACANPFLMQINKKKYKIPCGWCMACRIDKANQWRDRILFECQKKPATFVTLTYDDEHINTNESLEKQEAINFIKRFRENTRRHGRKENFKYYLVGEYGDRFGRPHYHAILMNISCFTYADEIEKAWGKGQIKTSPAKTGSIGYVLKYIQKQAHQEQAEEIYDKQGLERPFAIMSKGIGREYLEKHMDEMSELNGYYYKGKIRPLPQYYKNIMRLGEKKDNTKKIHNITEQGYDYEEYCKAIALLKEKHIIQDMRNKKIPIDTTYMNNMLPRSEYIERAKQITRKLDLTNINPGIKIYESDWKTEPLLYEIERSLPTNDKDLQP